MKVVNRVLSAAAILTSWCFYAAADEPALTGLDAQIKNTLSDFAIPGLAIGIVANGKVLKTQGYGLRDIKNRLPATADTQFSVGSTTKAFTSFLIATLVDEGKLDWDLPVKHYLPQWQLADVYATNHVNLTDMLSHRTGLPRHDLLWIGFPELTGAQLVKKLPYLSLSKELRQRYQYNNLMYGMAGYIAEQVTGTSWSNLVQQRILNKLEMNNTSLSYSQMLATNNYAQPYNLIGDSLTQVPQKTNIDSVVRPAGGIHSSVKDMSKWMLMLLNEGKYPSTEGQQSLIKRRSLAKLQVPHTPISSRLSKHQSPRSYGLGWDIETVDGFYQVYHGGNIDGFTASVITYPQQGIGVVVLVNKGMSDIPYNLAMDVSGRLLGNGLSGEPRNYVAEALQQKLKGHNPHEHHGPAAMTRPAVVLDAPFSFERYAGRYRHPAYGELTISVVAADGKADVGQLLQIQYGSLSESFDHWHFNTFIGDADQLNSYFGGEEMTFNVNAKGEIVGVTVPFEARLGGIEFTRLVPVVIQTDH
ncbi:MAG: CubicO group peptidase (beta-lactamase class C family) [Phenylobacterium sp.]|jgi:CubicO group peptidase (beta-lactamase class C family)